MPSEDDVKLPKWINTTTLAFMGVVVTIAMAWSNLRTTQEFQNKRLEVLEASRDSSTDTIHRMDVTLTNVNSNMAHMARTIERLEARLEVKEPVKP